MFEEEASKHSFDKDASLHTVKYPSSVEDACQQCTMGDVEISYDINDDGDMACCCFCSAAEYAQRLCLVLCGLVWTSMLAFGLFIAYQYIGASVLRGNMEAWNEVLTGLYDSEGTFSGHIVKSCY